MGKRRLVRGNFKVLRKDGIFRGESELAVCVNEDEVEISAAECVQFSSRSRAQEKGRRGRLLSWGPSSELP